MTTGNNECMGQIGSPEGQRVIPKSRYREFLDLKSTVENLKLRNVNLENALHTIYDTTRKETDLFNAVQQVLKIRLVCEHIFGLLSD